MTSLTFEDHCRAIVDQTDLLRTEAADADPTTPVPSCPGWDLGRLLRHVGGDHRWAEAIVRTRSAEPLPDDGVNDPAVYAHVDGEALDAWLGEGASELAAALRDAGPGVPVWTPADEQLVEQSTSFWARRMTHETVVHRADAVLATGGRFTLDEGLAVDGVEEWLDFSTVPEAYEPGPDAPGLLGPGRTLSFEATGAGQWLVDLTGARPLWRPGVGDAAVSVRGSATDLLLFLYRRPTPAVETDGDTALLDRWLTRTGFWLEL
ncbi:maleylpyruvate isomerase family mycothiol-dependent enzyme [Streptomyces cylindrosporus]|uniref:Maleylpyruvate isomerase family mycothiol-dependent enzyme n=1 Tax=Streptomyces cylindrosporus TaxID=2927583 RepID=A0ABS9Y9U3_9ACTN|nr:maleylpyruvate isomerase family mycothiol-dependent enzyme [Streptomyces cylindrosporus]MCI3273992.1 maleylpyruvate isomerase family mycothiol-dependent enzyme [Streptomyces cylindrosporus]